MNGKNITNLNKNLIMYTKDFLTNQENATIAVKVKNKKIAQCFFKNSAIEDIEKAKNPIINTYEKQLSVYTAKCNKKSNIVIFVDPQDKICLKTVLKFFNISEKDYDAPSMLPKSFNTEKGDVYFITSRFTMFNMHKNFDIGICFPSINCHYSKEKEASNLCILG